MNTNTIQSEILGLENKYWDAMKNNDVDTAISLTKFPCIISSPKGVKKVDEAAYRKMMTSMKGDSFKGVELQNPQVELLNEDTALISYSLRFNDRNMLDVSTWVREGNKWVCAFHSENPLN